MSRDDGGPAFPTVEYGYENVQFPKDGMSLRDYFAAHAPVIPDWYKHEATRPMPPTVDKTALTSWINEQKAAKFFGWRGFFADAMIAERIK